MLFILSTQRVVISQRVCELLDWCITRTTTECNNSWPQAAKHHAVATRHKIALNSQSPGMGSYNQVTLKKTFPSLAHFKPITYSLKKRNDFKFKKFRQKAYLCRCSAKATIGGEKAANFVARESRPKPNLTREKKGMKENQCGKEEDKERQRKLPWEFGLITFFQFIIVHNFPSKKSSPFLQTGHEIRTNNDNSIMIWRTGYQQSKNSKTRTP